MDINEQTIQTWNQLAEKYQQAFMHLTLYDKSYDLFCEILNNKNAGILEVGCGPGNISKYLISKNKDYHIHATDAAPSMIELAKLNIPEASFEVFDCRNIKLLNQKFDAIVCGFCLPYLNKFDFKNLIQDSFDLLNKNGVIYLSTIEGNYEDSKFEYSSDGMHKMFVYYYDENFIASILKVNNFMIREIIRIPYTKPNLEVSTHLIFIASR